MTDYKIYVLYTTH